ncbi:hypothetical protein Ao3042_07493 [Aspergillus oryzae 3.042]|uniref:Uncharacterized protein n=1 Tax=Aspergillus oryzae (strain 3.042) TaxID=1160506 RepID=I8IEH9_ASPO3|nr:hypothetical protein Ao3042_07493 [Aspergillus oryzae 3.042]|eukprot:EIT76416.1 hypothetical protein Ao3042_07493 [Aspergillus oryzae 3.042]
MTAVLITGATVKQGGSLITSLISRNAPFEILAVTRNPTSTSTQKLRSLSPSIKLVEGDLDNPARIFQNAQHLTSSPIWGVYSVQVKHSYTNPTKIPHFIKKHNIEHHLVDRSKNTSMEWTILRPTAFYENLTPDFFGKVFATSFKMALKGKKLRGFCRILCRFEPLSSGCISGDFEPDDSTRVSIQLYSSLQYVPHIGYATAQARWGLKDRCDMEG